MSQVKFCMTQIGIPEPPYKYSKRFSRQKRQLVNLVVPMSSNWPPMEQGKSLGKDPYFLVFMEKKVVVLNQPSIGADELFIVSTAKRCSMSGL